MNLKTIDCAILTNPFDVLHPKLVSEEAFYLQLARAFEFYEQAVEEGHIQSYGISGNDTLRYSTSLLQQRI